MIYVKYFNTAGQNFRNHLKFISSIVFKDPQDLEGVYVYIQAKKHKDKWLRVQIIRWHKSEGHFSVEYQNNTKTGKKLKLVNESFVVDQTLHSEVCKNFNVKESIYDEIQDLFNSKKTLMKVLSKQNQDKYNERLMKSPESGTISEKSSVNQNKLKLF